MFIQGRYFGPVSIILARRQAKENKVAIHFTSAFENFYSGLLSLALIFMFTSSSRFENESAMGRLR
jgi:hypothetical protein